jgi:hypothetical protein
MSNWQPTSRTLRRYVETTSVRFGSSFFAKLAAFGDRAAMLECKLKPKERRRAILLIAYEAEIESLHDAAKRLRSPHGIHLLAAETLQNGTLDDSEGQHPKAVKYAQTSGVWLIKAGPIR